MEQISRQYCQRHPSGEDIYLFTLRNNKGAELKITNYGAIVNTFRILLKDGQPNDIVLGFDDISQYWSDTYLSKHPWFGCAVGRYSNRIKNAEFVLDGKKYRLSRNNGNEQLHGGIDGFDKKTWEQVASGDTPHPFLELRYRSPDGEEGFPGNLDVTIRYELTHSDEFSYTFHAVTDAPTPVNLTHHGYFNLDNGQGKIDDHWLRIPASYILEQEENRVVNGKQVYVGDTPYDFREFHRIGDGLSQVPEYDNTFVIDAPAGEEPVLVAETKSLRSGILLQLYSTEPVVHFYSGKWIPPVTGKYNTPYLPFSGFCLETHKHPNAVNIPHFPDTILRPGETYFQKTIYKWQTEIDE
jgi:aldose 1-epimerase